MNFPFSSFYKFYQSDFATKALEELFRHKKFIKLCSHFMTLDIISAQIRKLAKFPLTKLTYSHSTKKDEIFDKFFSRHMQLSSGGHTLEEIGTEVLGYGNSFVSLYIPFRRYFFCQNCSAVLKIKDLISKKRNNKFVVTDKGIKTECPKCRHHGEILRRDHTSKKDVDKASLFRWDLNSIDIKYIDCIGKRIYYYNINSIEHQRICTERDPDYLEYVPWEIINAAFNKKEIRFNEGEIFHMRGPTINGVNLAWGLPILMPAMLTAIHIQQLRKANDVAAEDRTKAHDFLFPAPVAGVDSPANMLNMADWEMFIAQEIDEHRKDPARTSFSPVPLGKVTVGGDARTFMVYPEIRQCLEEVASGLGLPVEFMFGGGNYSGASVSYRSVEMFLSSFQEDYQNLINWVLGKLSRQYDLPDTKATLKRVKMADDVQQTQIYLTLLQLGKLDEKTFYDKTGLGDWEEIEKNLRDTSRTTALLSKAPQNAQLDAQATAALIQNRQQGNDPLDAPPQQGAPQQGLPPDMAGAAGAPGMAPAPPGMPPAPMPAGPPVPQLPADYTPEVIALFVQRFGLPLEAVRGAQLEGIPPQDLLEVVMQGQGTPGAAPAPPSQGVPQDPQGIMEMVRDLMSMPAFDRQNQLAALQAQDPAAYAQIAEILQNVDFGAEPATAEEEGAPAPAPYPGQQPPAVDMRPLPVQKPPVRATLRG